MTGEYSAGWGGARGAMAMSALCHVGFCTSGNTVAVVAAI